MSINKRMRKKLLFALLSIFLLPLGVMAQNVTVHPNNGSMLPARKNYNVTDVFYNWNGFATWKHNQLSLTITTGDSDNNLTGDSNQLTAAGQLSQPANDIFASAADSNGKKYLQIGKGGIQGSGLDTYLTICLPKGYSFTGYTITFHRISSPNGKPKNENAQDYDGNISFGETDNSFTYRSTSNTSGTYRGSIDRGNTTQFTLSRTSTTDTDMDNVLYFKLSNNKVLGRAFIQLDHVELYFTAEHNYAPLLPTPNVNEQSAVDISFTTSKMDYGKLLRRDINGNIVTTGGRISYDGTIHDLNANLTLYERGSVRTVTDNEFDGTAGDIVKYQSGSISSAGDYFKLDASLHNSIKEDERENITAAEKQDTAIYYIESPIWAMNAASTSAHKDPIGYRIVGASFDLKGASEAIPATFRIQHVGSDGNTYGLNQYNQTLLQYNQNLDYQTIWRIDEDGYIYFGTGDSRKYLTLLRYWDDYYFQVTSTKPNETVSTFEIVENNGIKQIRLKNYPDYYIGFYEDDWYGSTESYAYLTTDNDRAFYTEITPAGESTIEQYTFVIYDKTGTKVERKAVINGNNSTLSIDGLNNDAIKIGVIGTGYISGQLTMQALDPYIDHIDIVCQEQGGNGGKLTQQFNATDFTVRGGKFTFYVPEDFQGDAKFTFTNLYSKYGDNSYYGNTNSKNHARYFFVESPYAQTADNVYERSESASYKTKILTDKPGNQAFTFNNAATVTSTGGEFKEYPFSVNLYQDAGGEFQDFIFEQDEMNGETEKTAYLFTCDETRYNIAPTTATQHVSYAFYQMTIEMEKQTYSPQLAWKKIYDNTFDGNNNRDSKWGLTLKTDEVTDDQGTHSGYLTVTQILDYINGRDAVPATYYEEGDEIPEGKHVGDVKTPEIAAIPTALTGNGAPSSMNQILYIDGSDLMSIMENQTTKVDNEGHQVTDNNGNPQYDTHSVSELMTGLSKNALIYLPYGSTNSDNNFAFNTTAQYGETKNFRGSNNIVIEDKYPFYAPYKIQVDAEKYAKYERGITLPKYGQDVNATIMLPFNITLDNGIHSAQDGWSFKVNQLTTNSNISPSTDNPEFYGTAYFEKVTEPQTEANQIYMVNVLDVPEDVTDISFKVEQKGATIERTPDPTAVSGITYKGVFIKDGTYNVSFNSAPMSFTNYASYSGAVINHTGASAYNVFYFGNNQFVNMNELNAVYKEVFTYPFRGMYTYAPRSTGGSSREFKLKAFNISYDVPEGDITGIDGINDNLKDKADLMIRSDKSCMTITSTKAQVVTIYSANGACVAKVNMQGGDTQTLNLPSGMYVVNNVKIAVK